MSQKRHKHIRRTARLMADMKQQMEKSQKSLIPSDQSHYKDSRGQIKNNPLTERGTARWLKRNAK